MLLGSSITLNNGLRVRLRLPHGADRAGLRALYALVGLELDDVGLSRVMRLDPRSRAAICATGWIGGAETIVGFAAADLGSQPEVVVVDDAVAPGLAELLASALVERGATGRDVA